MLHKGSTGRGVLRDKRLIDFNNAGARRGGH
jgi:hypothetical protein